MGGVGRDGVVYGLLCFVAGFVLGAVRELLLIRMLGPDLGRWVELPLVTLAAVGIAWRLVATRPDRRIPAWVALGAIGVATLLALESTLALVAVGMSVRDYLATFDISQGALFPIGLGIMLAAPAMLAALAVARGPR